MTQLSTNFSPLLPTKLSDYNISLNNLNDTLVCILEYSNYIYESRISQSELKSGLVTLQKLQNIIRSNSKVIQPHYVINIESTRNNQTCSNHLIMHISYSSDFFDFEETIFFKEKSALVQTDNEIARLNQIIIEQQQKINIIEQRLSNIESLESRLNELEYNKLIYPNIEGTTFYGPISRNGHILTLSDDYDWQQPHNACMLPPRLITASFYGQPINIGNYCNYYHGMCVPSNEHDNLINKFKQYTTLNFKEIYTQFSGNCLSGVSLIMLFFDTYLSNKTDFKIDLISICDNRIVETLLKYNNYNKLVIKYDKEFNDLKIKNHCDKNNIVFDYI
jgi:hypothetical protein